MNGKLTYEDRKTIERLYKTTAVSRIAKELNRDESTIWCELKRGGSPYLALRGQEAADKVQGVPTRLRLEREHERVEKIKAYLKEYPALKISELAQVLSVSRPTASKSYKKALMELFQEEQQENNKKEK